MRDPRLHASVPGLSDAAADTGGGSGESLLAQRLRGRRSVRPSRLGDLEFVWRALMGEEKQECLGGALQRFSDLGIPPELRYFGDLEDELCWQILFRAMRDPRHQGDDREPYPRTLAASVDEVRRLLTVDQRDALVSEYLDFEEEISPPVGAGEAFLAEIEAAIKKNGTPADRLSRLINFGSRALATYLLSTASPPSSSPTSSSPTSASPGQSSAPAPEPRTSPTPRGSE